MLVLSPTSTCTSGLYNIVTAIVKFLEFLPHRSGTASQQSNTVLFLRRQPELYLEQSSPINMFLQMPMSYL